MTRPEDRDLEQVVLDCLEAERPLDELARRTNGWSAAQRSRARRALEGVIADEAAMAPPPDPAPVEIAGYRIVRTLAAGGMGVVYLARQEQPIRRNVAIKVIRDDVVAQQIRQRFELERQALALMEHDGIAKIYDASTTADGRPFLVMEFVAGQPITEYCDAIRLDTRTRLELFEQVCLAVQHAHHRGIIHRDLKPSNVLVTGNRDRPVPKIIDFGLARPTHAQLIDVSIHTQHGALVGTPAYMSPEQAEGAAEQVDTRTDIYSLGAILYELLTGRLARSEQDLHGTPAEVQRQILESDVPRPSSRLSAHEKDSDEAARKRGASAVTLSRDLRGDLDWITLKAMERDRSRRYQTASELAADVRRFLADEPVSAGPPTLSYRLRKLYRRHRASALTALGVAAVLLVATVVSTLFYLDSRRNLEEFELLRFRIELDDAIAAADDLYPARPEQADALQRWMDERAEPLRRARELVVASIARQPDAAADNRHRFLLRTMRQLRADLDGFLAPQDGLVTDVDERLQWARTVRERSIDRHAERWQRVCRSLSAATDDLPAGYHGQPIELSPQIGLVPIGINPVTHLWEFHHLRSAADPDTIPQHGEDGAIPVTDDTGIVFVLVPGGKGRVGVQRDDPQGPNYDPAAMPNEGEGPPREVEMSPLFVARHELTIGQWQRLTRGETPSTYKAGTTPRGMRQPITASHPVESVSQRRAARVLAQHGLQLPTEVE
ncbi:MAG: protein kinase, partial [Planctomycetes bacterium]|nr:protein kinase [Planctomycetota bacterium]